MIETITSESVEGNVIKRILAGDNIITHTCIISGHSAKYGINVRSMAIDIGNASLLWKVANGRITIKA